MRGPPRGQTVSTTSRSPTDVDEEFKKFVTEVRATMRKRNAPLWHTLKGERWRIGRGNLLLFTVGDFNKELVPKDIDLISVKAAIDTIPTSPRGQVVIYPPVLKIKKEGTIYAFEVGDLEHKVYLDK